MQIKLHELLIAGILSACVATVPLAMGQDDHSKMGKTGKMSGMKMSHDEAMEKMGKMTADDKAAMCDRMAAKDKRGAMKDGHDISKMSTQEKADMFDKMPMDKQMSLMSGRSSSGKGMTGKKTSMKM